MLHRKNPLNFGADLNQGADTIPVTSDEAHVKWTQACSFLYMTQTGAEVRDGD